MSTASETTNQPTSAEAPIARSIILWLLGVMLALLLNGQTFTNAIGCLGFIAASAFGWWRYDGQLLAGRQKTVARIVLLCHLGVILIVMTSLPEAWRFERKFNEAVRNARMRERQ